MKILYIGLAFLCTGIGAVGIVLPILPTTPFLLLASYLFAKGSDRFHEWFTHTKLYRKHLESFVKSRGMTLKSKLCILLPVSAMLITTMVLVRQVHARIAILILIVIKYWYFFCRIETLSLQEIEQNVSSDLDKGGTL
ncbi:MAG TPA: DUF454 domain-containing protein [Lachnospiraceae bacterium]|nr:YbaN family protein [uncultured Lachnoclostridium sp.]HAU87736.1 DUF454 domain-containing protein [Lachnospiraceae bacterium]